MSLQINDSYVENRVVNVSKPLETIPVAHWVRHSTHTRSSRVRVPVRALSVLIVDNF